MRSLSVVIVGFGLMGPATPSGAAEEPPKTEQRVKDRGSGQALNLYIENDTRGLGGPGSDQAYTNGFRVSYVFAESEIPFWAESTMNLSAALKHEFENSIPNFSFAIGQQLYTPNDTQNTELILDDRPYASWLYASFSAQFRTENRIDSIEANIGTIGNTALGEQSQNSIHDILKIPTAKGWRNELNSEPTLQFTYQRRLKFFQLSDEASKRKYFDVTPHYGAALGNVAINAHAGALFRAGLNLPDDFGPARASGDGDSFVPVSQNFSRPWSLYAFAGGRATGVLRNIFLDGNTFQASHRVTRRAIVLETEFGAGALWKQFGVTWRFVTRSPEFQERDEVASFASLSLTYFF